MEYKLSLFIVEQNKINLKFNTQIKTGSLQQIEDSRELSNLIW